MGLGKTLPSYFIRVLYFPLESTLIQISFVVSKIWAMLTNQLFQKNLAITISSELFFRRSTCSSVRDYSALCLYIDS